MKKPYLEIAYRHGRAIAGYLYLPRSPGDKSRRTPKANPGMIIDYTENGKRKTENGKPIGIEINDPSKVTVDDLNRVLADLGVAALTTDDIAPLMAA